MGHFTRAAARQAGASPTVPKRRRRPRRIRFKRPTWDPTKRELRLGTAVVKQFRQPAGNQELILTAFQEEGWPQGIMDPLRPRAGLAPKRRLHATIVKLNQCQLWRLIRFRGDGTGTGIRWELVV